MREPLKPTRHGGEKLALPLNPLWEGRGPRTIRGTLIWMVVLCVLPAWIGIAVLILSMYTSERERSVQSTIMTAHSLVLAVDGDLAAARTMMEALATSRALEADEFAAFYKKAHEVICQAAILS